MPDIENLHKCGRLCPYCSGYCVPIQVRQESIRILDESYRITDLVSQYFSVIMTMKRDKKRGKTTKTVEKQIIICYNIILYRCNAVIQRNPTVLPSFRWSWFFLSFRGSKATERILPFCHSEAKPKNPTGRRRTASHCHSEVAKRPKESHESKQG